MAVDRQHPKGEPIVYLDRSEVRSGALPELRQAVGRIVTFVQGREPQLLAYGFHIDEGTSTMTVVAVHPDAASLERHLRVGGPEFRKVAGLIVLRAIEVYGEPGEEALRLLHEKAVALGGASVAVHPRTAGFARI